MAIDVTFQEGVDGYSGTKDAHVIEFSDHNFKNTGGNDENECCRYVGSSDSDDKWFLISFDLSSIPSNVTVTSAALSLYVRRFRNGTPNKTVHAYQITGSWTEGSGTGIDGQDVAGVDWLNKPGFDSTSLDSNTIGGTSGWYSWSITDLVQDWVNGNKTNYGVYIKEEDGSESTSNGTKVFASRQYSTTTIRPKLNVVYTTAKKPQKNTIIFIS